MARGVTEDEVWKACDALLLEGARPTIERVDLASFERWRQAYSL